MLTLRRILSHELKDAHSNCAVNFWTVWQEKAQQDSKIERLEVDAYVSRDSLSHLDQWVLSFLPAKQLKYWPCAQKWIPALKCIYEIQPSRYRIIKSPKLLPIQAADMKKLIWPVAHQRTKLGATLPYVAQAMDMRRGEITVPPSIICQTPQTMVELRSTQVTMWTHTSLTGEAVIFFLPAAHCRSVCKICQRFCWVLDRAMTGLLNKGDTLSFGPQLKICREWPCGASFEKPCEKPIWDALWINGLEEEVSFVLDGLAVVGSMICWEITYHRVFIFLCMHRGTHGLMTSSSIWPE